MQVEREEHCERCTSLRCYQSWCDGLEAPKDRLAEHYCSGLQATVCAVATILFVSERDNQEGQEARCKRGTVQARNIARC